MLYFNLRLSLTTNNFDSGWGIYGDLNRILREMNEIVIKAHVLRQAAQLLLSLNVGNWDNCRRSHFFTCDFAKTMFKRIWSLSLAEEKNPADPAIGSALHCRSGWWHVISMGFLRSFLRRPFSETNFRMNEELLSNQTN